MPPKVAKQNPRLPELYEADTDRHCNQILVGQRATLGLKFPFPRTRAATSSPHFLRDTRCHTLIPAATECDWQLSHTKRKHSEGIFILAHSCAQWLPLVLHRHSLIAIHSLDVYPTIGQEL